MPSNIIVYAYLEEYKAQVREYNITCVKEKFTWEKIGTQLKDIIALYS